jgi:hypothetical protein
MPAPSSVLKEKLNRVEKDCVRIGILCRAVNKFGFQSNDVCILMDMIIEEAHKVYSRWSDKLKGNQIITVINNVLEENDWDTLQLSFNHNQDDTDIFQWYSDF